jgi:hypothetical protein
MKTRKMKMAHRNQRNRRARRDRRRGGAGGGAAIGGGEIETGMRNNRNGDIENKMKRLKAVENGWRRKW